jgi:2-alkyl-3-oxoalkanoate reductase
MTRIIAVLGASGFIGSRAVEMMSLLNTAEVRPVVRRPAALASSARLGLPGRIADARDANALEQAFTGCDSVIHAVAGDVQTILGCVAPVYLAAQAAGVRRLIYLSSASVHGQSPDFGTDEASELNDRQPIEYNNAKIKAERQLLALRQSGKVEVVILRPGIVFGPRSSWTGGFADELLSRTAYLIDGGKGICNSVYVDNVVHAIEQAIEEPRADGQAYLICDYETVTWADLYEPVAKALGFNIESILVTMPMLSKQTWQRRFLDDQTVRATFNSLPSGLRRILKAGYSEWKNSQGHPAGSKRNRKITITEERFLLYCNKTKLQSHKAKRELGYRPTVGFEEACRRSIGWLAFAGYPIKGIENTANDQ